MKKCQGTFNYIFSPHSLSLLEDLGMTTDSSKKTETSGYISQDIWLTDAQHSDFCIQFREIINEEEFLAGVNSSNIEIMAPGFIEKKNLTNQDKTNSPFKLVGLLLEDIGNTKEQILQWEFPCEIFWFSPNKGEPFHQFPFQLSYKKKFPFWAVILKCDDLKSVSDLVSAHINEVEFQNNKALWVHLETTSWDFLIIN